MSAAEAESILFLVETNPGPGIGILLRIRCSERHLKRSARDPDIQFLGGIHEIYFPYVLMKPLWFARPSPAEQAASLTATVFQSVSSRLPRFISPSWRSRRAATL